MEKLAFRGEAKDVAQKQTTLKNLLVLRKETESEATSVWNQGAIVPFILNLINDKAENGELIRVFNAMAKMDRQKEMKPDPEVAEANKLWIVLVLLERIIRVYLQLQEMLQDPKVGVFQTETLIDLFVEKPMHMDGGIPCGWSWKYVDERGLLVLLDVASQIPEQCDYPVSAETRQHVVICLQKFEEDMVFDTKRLIFHALSSVLLERRIFRWLQ
ncbi:unnamed protein product [Caenorhabditis nigoni]